MDPLFMKRMAIRGGLSNHLKKTGDILMNVNFDHDENYKRAILYDWDLKKLEEVDIKFQYSQKYSINKDQVEYLVQFRPLFHPEIKYRHSDNIERLGFFLDIPDDTGRMNKWLLLGRNDEDQFVRYNALKCNWNFKFMVDGVIYEQLGVLRDRNNYNSGVWSDGFVTSVENQAQFIVPTNRKTELIDYDMRFMLSDNAIHPIVYSVTKRTDTFPLGINKITLSQGHFDKEKDNPILKICDYYSSKIKPKEDLKRPESNNKVSKMELKYTGNQPVLVIGGTYRTITAITYDDLLTPVDAPIGSWLFYLNKKPVTINELLINYDIEIKDNQLQIKAHKTYEIIGDVLGFQYSVDDIHKAFLEFEVKSV